MCMLRPLVAGVEARDLVTLHQAKGAGYAISRQEELETITELSQSTGQLAQAALLALSQIWSDS